MKFLPEFSWSSYIIIVFINICLATIFIITDFTYFWPVFIIAIIDWWLIFNLGDSEIPYLLKEQTI